MTRFGTTTIHREVYGSVWLTKRDPCSGLWPHEDGELSRKPRIGPDGLLHDDPVLKPAQWTRHVTGVEVNGVETEAALNALRHSLAHNPPFGDTPSQRKRHQYSALFLRFDSEAGHDNAKNSSFCDASDIRRQIPFLQASFMRILFLHGWHSIVGGVKPTFLKSAGHEVINPALHDNDFELAVSTAQRAFDESSPDVVVGSSRGGAVALNIASANVPLVLLYPAWKNWGQVRRLKANCVILHSRDDEVIPFEHSEELIGASGLSHDRLLEIGLDHRLADEESLRVMLWACKMLVSAESDELFQLEECPRRRRQTTPDAEASYICDACGEEIVVPLDLTEETRQIYVEDCPVCCRASVIHVEVDDMGNTSVRAEPEQDRE